MKAYQAQYPIRTLCRVLGLSTSGYYAWCQRQPSARTQANADLMGCIRQAHVRSRGTYGAPRVQAELQAAGLRVGRRRVARLMREAGLQGVSRRRWVCTTHRNRRARPAPDLVQRRFQVHTPNQLWVADITYVPTWAGFLYLAVILDAFSRRVVGWAMARHLRTELVLDALDMALERRKPGAVVHHSDQGCQYTPVAFSSRCRQQGVRLSMGSVGDCYDNALVESFFATLECELLQRSCFQSQSQAKRALFEYIEGWYNPHRRHSRLGQKSPMEFEKCHPHAA